MTALRHWSDILITVQSSASFTVRIVWPIQLWKSFSCLFLLFMLTLPLHEVMIPPFFFFLFLIFFHKWILAFALFFFSPSYPTYLIPFLYCWFLFLTTASWNRSGWHPRSLTGQCTSHLPLLLLTFSPLFLLSFNTPRGFIAPSGLLLTASNHVSPLHIAVFPPI